MNHEDAPPSPRSFAVELSALLAAQRESAQAAMTPPDYSDLRSRHRREIRDDEWPRHESDPRILALGVLSVVVAVLLIVGVTGLAVRSA